MSILEGRTNSIQDAPIKKLLSSVSSPKDVISLGQGIPFFGPPIESIKAASQILDKKEGYCYSEDEGFLSLRETISEKIQKENSFKADPNDNIIVTYGGNQGFVNALLSITDFKDEIIVLSPYYFNHVMAIEMAGCKPVIVETDNNFSPNLEKIFEGIASRTKGIITVSPNNPTGAVYPKKVLKEINDFCSKENLIHISDEAYEYFVFDKKSHVSPTIFDKNINHTISLFTCSKSFGMSGYRIGFMIIPSYLYHETMKVQDTIGICAPSPSQAAAEEALQIGKVYANKFLHTMSNMRKIFIKELQDLNCIDFTLTTGGFYFFIKLKTSMNSINVSKKLIEKYGIITIPGEFFGAKYPSLRISYGNLDENKTIEGCRRLTKGLGEILS